MPRRSKGARLWLRPARRNKEGKVVRRPAWVILDGGKYITTGCVEGEAERAEQLLANYISQKYHPDRAERELGLDANHMRFDDAGAFARLVQHAIA